MDADTMREVLERAEESANYLRYPNKEGTLEMGLYPSEILDCIKGLQQENATLRRQKDQVDLELKCLRVALEEYGEHHPACDIEMNPRREAVCTCGLYEKTEGSTVRSQQEGGNGES